MRYGGIPLSLSTMQTKFAQSLNQKIETLQGENKSRPSMYSIGWWGYKNSCNLQGLEGRGAE